MSVVSSKQKSFYEEEGYLVIGGLIPDQILTEAESVLRGIAENSRPAGGERSTTLHLEVENPELVRIFHTPVVHIAAQLARADPLSFRIPRKLWAMIEFPQAGEWKPRIPHIDHALPEDQFRIFPPPIRISIIVYLTDVPYKAGGTVLWRRSHKEIEKYANANSDRLKMMFELNQSLSKISLGGPIELTVSRGDVLFYHRFCAHSGSVNTSSGPRLAIGKKW